MIDSGDQRTGVSYQLLAISQMQAWLIADRRSLPPRGFWYRLASIHYRFNTRNGGDRKEAQYLLFVVWIQRSDVGRDIGRHSGKNAAISGL